jgi:hypothetical protein
MNTRACLAAVALVLLPLATRAADEDNPYRNTKVGDYFLYKLVAKLGNQTLDGSLTEVVTARTDKEVLIKVTGKMGGADLPVVQLKIDLNKPFDPSKVGPSGADVKVEKGRSGKEKIKVLGKEYEATWTNYKLKGKAGQLDLESDLKVWTAEGGPAPILRMEQAILDSGIKSGMTMELSETGNKK